MSCLDDPREAYMLPCEIAREEAIEYVEHLAQRGRLKQARAEIRSMILHDFANEPANYERIAGKVRHLPGRNPAWVKGIRDLLELRRRLPAIWEKSRRAMNTGDLERLLRGNELFHGEHC